MRTRGQGLLELLGLVGILKDESVDEARGADLELDVVGLGVLLYAGSYPSVSDQSLEIAIRHPSKGSRFHPVSLRSAAIARCDMLAHCLSRNPKSGGLKKTGCRKRTGSILAPANLDELLDVADFGRHFGGIWGVDGFVSKSPTIVGA
jgi:hypothetical protein